MNDLKYPERQTHSQETLAELNPQELLQRIQAAERAIFLRLQGMQNSSIDLVEGADDPRRLGLFGASHERNTGIRRFASRSDSRRRPSVVLALEKPRLYWCGSASRPAPTNRERVYGQSPLARARLFLG